MAFPTVDEVVRYTSAGAVVAHTIPYPATVEAGDLFVAIFGFGDEGGAPVAWGDGFTGIATDVDSASLIAVGYKIAAGDEDGGSFDITPDLQRRGACHLYHISGWHGTTPPEVATIATGNDASPDPGSLSPSWGSDDTLWIAYGRSENGGNTYTAAPASYTDLLYDFEGSGAAGGSIGSARRELATATEDPGAFTATSSEPWLAGVVAVRPAAGGGGGTTQTRPGLQSMERGVGPTASARPGGVLAMNPPHRFERRKSGIYTRKAA